MHSFDDEIWDEFKWESHINKLEHQNRQLRAFFEHGNRADRPRWEQLMDEYGSKIEAINAFIEEELLIEESYFPDDEDLEDDDEEFEDPFFGFNEEEAEEDDDEDPLFGESLDDELDEWDDDGEDWKSLSDDFVMSDYGSIEQLPVYVEARSLGADLLKMNDSGHLSSVASEVRDLISQVLQIAAKLAAGYSFGFEKEVMGANIAYTKKALSKANLALQQWRIIHERNHVQRQSYLEMNARLFELRNDIGVYVQELREQFNKPDL